MLHIFSEKGTHQRSQSVAMLYTAVLIKFKRDIVNFCTDSPCDFSFHRNMWVKNAHRKKRESFVNSNCHLSPRLCSFSPHHFYIWQPKCSSQLCLRVNQRKTQGMLLLKIPRYHKQSLPVKRIGFLCAAYFVHSLSIVKCAWKRVAVQVYLSEIVSVILTHPQYH